MLQGVIENDTQDIATPTKATLQLLLTLMDKCNNLPLVPPSVITLVPPSVITLVQPPDS